MFRESVPTHAGSVAGVGGRRGVRFNPLLSVQLCGGLMHWPQWILWLAASVVVIVDRSLDFHGYGEVRVEGDRGEHTAGTSANHLLKFGQRYLLSVTRTYTVVVRSGSILPEVSKR